MKEIIELKDDVGTAYLELCPGYLIYVKSVYSGRGKNALADKINEKTKEHQTLKNEYQQLVNNVVTSFIHKASK